MSFDIRIRRGDIEAASRNRNGLTYKGFGVLSANSTSALLPDLKKHHPQAYWKLVRTLFAGPRPLFDLVKIEMGNDRDNSTGADGCTMRSRSERPVLAREPGFQLAADARSVADRPPHVSLLRWCRPAWVESDRDQSVWFKDTILTAYRELGFMVDSLNPDANETREPDLGLYRRFARWIRTHTRGFEATGSDADGPTASDAGWSSETERELFHRIRVVAADCAETPPT